MVEQIKWYWCRNFFKTAWYRTILSVYTIPIFYSPTQIVRKIRSPIVCIAIPAEVIEIREGNIGVVDYGDLQQEIRLDLVDVEVGEFVLIHVGFANQKMSKRRRTRDTQPVPRSIFSYGAETPVTL